MIRTNIINNSLHCHNGDSPELICLCKEFVSYKLINIRIATAHSFIIKEPQNL
jgi:hypothetical protein